MKIKNLSKNKEVLKLGTPMLWLFVCPPSTNSSSKEQWCLDGWRQLLSRWRWRETVSRAPGVTWSPQAAQRRATVVPPDVFTRILRLWPTVKVTAAPLEQPSVRKECAGWKVENGGRRETEGDGGRLRGTLGGWGRWGAEGNKTSEQETRGGREEEKTNRREADVISCLRVDDEDVNPIKPPTHQRRRATWLTSPGVAASSNSSSSVGSSVCVTVRVRVCLFTYGGDSFPGI